MQIKKLRLSGFKSFVEPAELVIRPGLTGVVGPNGCGKSNLLEAIRWVMGENSAKSMRGGGMDDVIFAGTERRPARDFAEVSLSADRETDDGETSSPADNDQELEIVRRIERGSGSAYRVNGQDVRAKDVALVFADAATGAHSPALVSQGKIGQVISAKPVERRQMLEEAAGIAGLHVRRKDAESKLRSAENNLSRLDDILADMEARANALRRQARQAERYKKLSAEIRVAEGRLIFAKWRDAAALAAAAKAEAVEAAGRVEQASQQQQRAVTAQTESARQTGILREELQQARDAASDVRMKLGSLTQERDSMRERLNDLQHQAERLAEDQSREDQQSKDALAELERLEAENKRLANEQRALIAARGPLADQVDAAERAVSEAEVALAKAAAEEARIAAEVKVAEAALQAADQRHARLLAEAEKLRNERAQVGDRGELAEARDAALTERDTAQTQIDDVKALIAELEEQRVAALAARDEAQDALAEAKAEESALNAEHRALERELAPDGDNAKALDQMQANPGFEHALAAALGDDLQAAIGEGDRAWTGATATTGTAPSGTQCLLDHVDAPTELHARLAQIFVADSDDGQSLSVGQRLVTRDGKMRRWDGFVALSGGGSSAERLVRQNRLRELAAMLPSTVAAREQAEALAEDKQAAIGAIKDRIDEARQLRQATDERLRALLRSVDEAEQALVWHDRRAADLTERESALSGDLKGAEAELSEARERRASQADGDSQRAVREQLETQRNSLREQQSNLHDQLAELDRTMATTREQKAVATEGIKHCHSRSDEAISRIQAMQKRAAEIATETERLADRPAVIEQEIAGYEAQQETLTEALTAKETTLAEAEAEAARHNAALSELAELLSVAREERAGAEARAEAQDLRRVEMGRIAGEKFECPPQLLCEKLDFDDETVGQVEAESGEHDRLVASRDRLGPVNLVAADELEELELERETSAKESAELIEAINKLRGSIGSLNREGRQRLLAAFEQVDQHFQRLFTTLFDGGKAHLELVDSDDPLEAGLEIMAQPPGKKLQTLTLLSGGEQALTAVALIFGLFLTNPAPICVLDEVDAPLDDANIERFCDLLDRMVAETRTRYLIVTHNAVTMSRMHRLFGVTMIEKGVSQLVSVDLDAAEELLAAE